MRNCSLPHLTLPLAMVLLVIPVATAQGEIYKWVDEDGKVHFGDKPRDSTSAQSAEKIEIKEDYAGDGRSHEEINRARREQETRWMEEQSERREKQEQLSAERLEDKNKKAEECARIQRTIDNFSGIQSINGRLTRHVLVDSDGKSLTTEQQKQKVAALEQKALEKGCTLKPQQ